MKYLENKEEFKTLINKERTLIDFYADWCGPCRMISPILEEMSNERTNVSIVKVDVDKYPEIAKEYGVMSIPTLIYFKEGKLIKQNVGYMEKQDIEELITD